MKGSLDNYFIKAGYSARPVAETFDATSGKSFWSPERLATAGFYQYHVYEIARDLLMRQNPGRVMDVGCGAPVKARDLLWPYCKELTLVDQPSVREVAGAMLPEAVFVPMDLEQADLRLDGYFDLIVCVDVLEHLLHPLACMEFIRAHLAPNGIAVLSTPERDHLRGKACNHSPKPEHVREWNAAEFAALVEYAGFVIQRQVLVSQLRLSKPEFELSRLLADFVKTRRWSACQVAICRRPGDT